MWVCPVLCGFVLFCGWVCPVLSLSVGMCPVLRRCVIECVCYYAPLDSATFLLYLCVCVCVCVCVHIAPGQVFSVSWPTPRYSGQTYSAGSNFANSAPD